MVQVLTIKEQTPSGRRQPVFYIACPNYTELSSGVRCLYILSHHLNRLGYPAFVTGTGAPAHLLAPRIGVPLIKANRAQGLDDIVVYPEVVAGNPLEGRKVVRYLLNKPGHFNSIRWDDGSLPVFLDHGLGMQGYDDMDFFAHFAEEFRPEGLRSFHLALPLVDQTIYRERSPQPRRRGFILYSHRHAPVLSALPDWVSPYTIVSIENPRSAAELAALYQEHEALVLWERTAAGTEAVQCGCPVIVIPGPDFDPGPILQRYRGNGFVIGWDEAGLKRAQQTVGLAARRYWHRYRSLNHTIHEFVRRVAEHFDRD